jgi:hypothetical protein
MCQCLLQKSDDVDLKFTHLSLSMPSINEDGVLLDPEIAGWQFFFFVYFVQLVSAANN